jgi:glycyl-tRNA synthetase
MAVTMETIVNLCKRRGFIYPSCEIYGGYANTYTFGPYGSELKNNIKNLWWKTFVQSRPDMVGIDGCILLHPNVWRASGHVSGFNDAMVDCKECRSRYRADQLIEDATGIDMEGKTNEEMKQTLIEKKVHCPKCGKSNFTDVRRFNMMFSTNVGTTEDDSSVSYLRPETAQAIFMSYNNVVDSTRQKIPFGIGQIGKAFRNEITPGNFIYRVIEFEQMEIEYFIEAEQWEKAFTDWQAEMWRWCTSLLKLKESNLRIHEHPAEKLSHYSKRTIDIEYQYPFGFKELYGLAYRTDFDLQNHQTASGKSTEYFDQANNKRYIPHVIEPTFGVDRSVLVVLLDCYHEEEAPTADGKTDTRTVLKFPHYLAPIKIAILPLLKKPELINESQKIFDTLKTIWPCEFDVTQSIGKRYRRQDEIGTPFALTFDFDSLQDKKVTIRDRDTMQQERVEIANLIAYFKDHLNE